MADHKPKNTMTVAHNFVAKAYELSGSDRAKAHTILLNHVAWYAKALHIITGYDHKYTAKVLRRLADQYDPVKPEDSDGLLDAALSKK